MSANMIIVGVILLCIAIFELVTRFIVYQKAGVSGWISLIPIYNIIVLFQLANISMWMIILLFIPIVQLYPLYLIYASLSVRLGKSRGYGILFIVLPFIAYPIFAFSKMKVESKYVNIEEVPSFHQPLMDGPIEPLGANPDIEPNVEEVSPLVEEIEPIPPINAYDPIPTISPIMEEYEPIRSVVEIPVEDPLTAQQKVQHIEEEKEIYPDVDVFKTCPNCGTKLEPNVDTCFLCGKRLDD